MGCRNQQHPPGAGGLQPLAQAGQRPWVSPGLWRNKARGLVPSSHCCPAGSGSVPLPQPGLGLFWDPALAFEFQPCCLQERGCLCGCSWAGAVGTRPLLCGSATPPVPLQTSCFISSRCILSAPATSPQKETPPPTSSWYETRRWGLPGLGKSPGDVQKKKKIKKKKKPNRSGLFFGAQM